MKKVATAIIVILSMISCVPAETGNQKSQVDSLQKELDLMASNTSGIVTFRDNGYFPAIGSYVNNSYTQEEIMQIKRLTAGVDDYNLTSDSYGKVGDAVAISSFVRLMTVSKELSELNAKVSSCGPQTHEDSLKFVKDFMQKNPKIGYDLIQRLDKTTTEP